MHRHALVNQQANGRQGVLIPLAPNHVAGGDDAQPFRGRAWPIGRAKDGGVDGRADDRGLGRVKPIARGLVADGGGDAMDGRGAGKGDRQPVAQRRPPRVVGADVDLRAPATDDRWPAVHQG